MRPKAQVNARRCVDAPLQVPGVAHGLGAPGTCQACTALLHAWCAIKIACSPPYPIAQAVPVLAMVAGATCCEPCSRVG